MAYKLPALMLALAACGTVSNDDPSQVSDDQPSTDPSDPGPEGTAFRFFTSSADGTARTDFDSVRAAYLNASGNLGVAPGDYYFTVNFEVCPPGQNQDEYFPELGPLNCRVFGVGANGMITRGTPVELDGNSCNRDNGIDAAGGITIGIFPFEQSVHMCSPIVVRVIPIGGGRHDAVATLFFNAPPPEQLPVPVCGNGVVEEGEACDDGNESDHDGCSALCMVEPDCHPMQQ